MLITLLGTGTPTLDQNRKGSSLLIEVGNEKLLFDAGRCVTTQLLKAGIQPQSVNPIFITHHHFDHIGNLGELLLTMWHNERTSQIDIFGPNGTSEIIAALFGQVFKRDIAFALFNKYNDKDIRDIVNVTEINPGLKIMGTVWDYRRKIGLALDIDLRQRGKLLLSVGMLWLAMVWIVLLLERMF
jgi:ribonuclease Z